MSDPPHLRVVAPLPEAAPIRSVALGAWLRELAERAEMGEFSAAAVGLATPRGAIVTTWYDPSHSARVVLIAAAATLEHQLIADVVAAPDEEVEER